MKLSKLTSLLLIILFVITVAGCSPKTTSPPETPTNLETPNNTNSLILISENDAWQAETQDGLYGYDPNGGWGNIETIFSTKSRYAKPWNAGFVLTFNQAQDSFVYIAIYNTDQTPKTLYINTYDNKTPPYNWKNILTQVIDSNSSQKYQVIKLNLGENDFYDNENREGIQQKFAIYAVDNNWQGVDSVKVVYIGNPGEKPELLFNKVQIDNNNLVVEISNIGLKFAENVTVKVYDSNNQELAIQTITLINPNTSKQLIFENLSNPATIKIDPENTIEEVIEDNNDYSIPQ